MNLTLTVGVSCGLRVRKIKGNWPRSAMPCSCNESALIPERNWANNDIPDATTTKVPSHLPPISVAANANEPAFQSACSISVAPVEMRMGIIFVVDTNNSERHNPFRKVRFGTALEKWPAWSNPLTLQYRLFINGRTGYQSRWTLKLASDHV